MKISSSAVTMDASRAYSFTSSNTFAAATFVAGIKPNRLNQSDESGQSQNSEDDVTLSDQAKKLSEQLRKQRQEEAEQKRLEAAQKSQGSGNQYLSEKDAMMLETLRQLLEYLKQLQQGGNVKQVKALQNQMKASKGVNLTGAIDLSGIAGMAAQGGFVSAGTPSGTQVWTRQTYSANFTSEKECTTFSSTGVAKTEDGRELSFNVDLTMSREFMQKTESFTEETGYFFTDPLVVNLSGNPASLSDQKFFFDLDADGKEEQISNLSGGSGFLALDKNGDGTINDGNELFGTKSGDGFQDLAAYDEDHNGWIDENDSVFKDLKIWTKNEDGSDRLVNLKEAGVGALYTGKADTQFSLNNEKNETNGIIRSTGVFLMENGTAGTLQHVDLAV